MATTTSNANNSNKKQDNNNNNKKQNNNKLRTGKQPSQNNNKKPSTAKFTGKCDDLKGHIFDCSNYKQSDMYVTTKQEIEEYVGRTYTYGADTKWSLENLEVASIDQPDPPIDPNDPVEEYIWKKEVDEYIRRKSQLCENLKTVQYVYSTITTINQKAQAFV